MSFSSTLEIIKVETPEVVPTSKGSYRKVSVAFRDQAGKVGGKQFMSFNDEKIFAQVLTLEAGSKYTVVQEKKENEKTKQSYWYWTEISTAGDVAIGPEVSSGSTATRPQSSGGRVTGSNYETPEERKIKQRYIVRQSAITAALKMTEINKGKVNLEDLFENAETIVNFVYEKQTPIEGIVEMDNDIPL